MDDANIRRLVQEEMQKSQLRSGFRMTSIPFHTHNGTDAPPVFSPTITYTGYVPSNGKIDGEDTSGFIFMPQGWKTSLDGTLYTVTHQLNTDFYTVTCALYGPEAPNAVTPNIVCLPNEFTVDWKDYLLISYQADFTFQLVQINNKGRSFPAYNAQGSTL